MPSFDVVSKLDRAEVKNALDQASREIGQRFDFRTAAASVERTPDDSALVVQANGEDRVRAAWDVLQQKLVRRKVSLKHFEPGEPEAGPKGSTKLVVNVKEGIPIEKAREIVKLLKESKLKVQASIQEDAVRVSGKKKDDLQSVIGLLRRTSLDLDLQFVNFRD